MRMNSPLRLLAGVLVAISVLKAPRQLSGQTIITNWDGGQNTDGFAPPDPHGAAGPSGIIGTYNVSVTYYDKAGGIIWGPTSLQNFFAAQGCTGQGLADPKVLYDRYSGRFFLINQETTMANRSFLNIAASKNPDPRSSSAADWEKYRLEMTEYSGGNTNGGDYPGFGLDSQAVYVTYNMFRMTNGVFQGLSLYSRLLSFDKTKLLAGRPLAYSSKDLGGSTLQPATPLDSSVPANRLYLVGSLDRNSLVLWAVDDPLGKATTNATAVPIPDNGGGATNNAPQPGVTNLVDVLDGRAQAAIFVRGNLWFSLTAGQPQGPSQVYYYRLNPNDYPSGSAVQLVESGILGEADYWNYQPALGGNFVGDLAVVYTRSSSLTNPTMMYCFRSATESSFGPPHVVANSGGPSITDGSQPDRWGDFAAVSADPTDGTLWITHEYARSANANNWGTWFAQIAVPFPWHWIGPAQTETFSGNGSLGTNGYVIAGGITTLQDDGGTSGILLRQDGGTLQLLDSATAANAAIGIDGGMGNGGLPGHLFFHGTSTAATAAINNHAGILGPNFKNSWPIPMDGWPGETRFYDNTSAGTALITNDGESHANASNGQSGGYTEFAGNSSADHAAFVTCGATISNGRGGRVDFTGNATAAQATFLNLNSNNGSPYSQGRTVFFDYANAAQGVFTNMAADSGFLPTGGTTEFRNNSSAGSATFHNLGGTGGGWPGPGKTQFFDSAVAGTGCFTNAPGTAGGGAVEFWGNSSADHGNFVNQTDPSFNGIGGTITFNDDSTAASASISHRGFVGGETHFRNRSTAGHATIVLDPHPAYNNSRLDFWDDSTAADANITTGATGTLLQFYNNSSAGNATITIGGNASFTDTATAANATITVLGSNLAGDSPASLVFTGSARTGNAHFIVQGATVNSYGASGGVIAFDYNGSAGSATFTVNGGSNGGPGGRITCGRGGDGGQARFIITAGGTLDVGGTSLYGGATAGSLEGAGTVLLSSAPLTLGAPNISTVFSGEIADGALYYPGVGGQLIKLGTGSFTLSGSNSYSGLTTVLAGTLAVNGSVRGDVLVKSGATLAGAGKIGGTVTAEAGALISPGNSPGTLTIAGSYSQAPQGLLDLEIAGPHAQDRDLLSVGGNINLSGKLLLVFSGYAPTATDSFTVIQAGGALNVSSLELIVLGLKPGYTPNYAVIGGTLTITASSGGQLTTGEDPIQALQPSWSPQSGFVYPVFTLSGLTYQFDTSTDLNTWTPVAQYLGANTLTEFRHLPPAADLYRFYRVIQKTP